MIKFIKCTINYCIHLMVIIYYFIIIPLITLLLLFINLNIAPHKPYQEKGSAFECGFHSFLGQNRTQFSVSFFIFALLFLLFDLEIILIYPFALTAYNNEAYGFIIIAIFFLLLTLGFAFELGKNALNIDSRQKMYSSKEYKKYEHEYVKLKSIFFELTINNPGYYNIILAVILLLIYNIFINPDIIYCEDPSSKDPISEETYEGFRTLFDLYEQQKECKENDGNFDNNQTQDDLIENSTSEDNHHEDDRSDVNSTENSQFQSIDDHPDFKDLVSRFDSRPSAQSLRDERDLNRLLDGVVELEEERAKLSAMQNEMGISTDSAQTFNRISDGIVDYEGHAQELLLECDAQALETEEALPEYNQNANSDSENGNSSFSDSSDNDN